MSKSQSKEFFKKKQRGRTKKSTSPVPVTVSQVGNSKTISIQGSQITAAGLLNGGEDPAVIIINPNPTTTTHSNKEKRTKICCLL